MEIYNFTALGNSRYLAEHPHTESGAYFKAEDVYKAITTMKNLYELKLGLTMINEILDKVEKELETKRQLQIDEYFARKREEQN